MSEIIKCTWSRSKNYVSAPTNSIRDIGERVLGKLDTATSFMYLFRRFGVPTESNEDEYKILYSYDLKYKDMLFSIHASYHEFVYFNARMPAKYKNARINEYKKIARNIAKRSLSNGVFYMPYSVPPELGIFSKKMQEKQNELFNEKAKSFFSEADYLFLCNFEHNDGVDSLDHYRPFYDKIKPFYDKLCEEFRSTLNKEELLMYNQGDDISYYPELKKQCEEFFNELLRGYYVRDVAINIRGYESSANLMLDYEE